MSKRALRRSHRQRMLSRAYQALVFQTMDVSDKRRWAVRQHDHLKACSCWMCGNPRKWYGEPTYQERRHLQGDRRRGRGGSFEWEEGS